MLEVKAAVQTVLNSFKQIWQRHKITLLVVCVIVQLIVGGSSVDWLVLLAFRYGIHQVSTLISLEWLVRDLDLLTFFPLVFAGIYLIVVLLRRVVSIIRGSREFKVLILSIVGFSIICISLFNWTPFALGYLTNVAHLQIEETKQINLSDLVGSYSSGDNGGENPSDYSMRHSLILKPDGSYLLQRWKNKNHELIWKSEGLSKMRAGYLFLFIPRSAVGFDRLLPVTWGQRHYLIEETDIVRFCNAISDGTKFFGKADFWTQYFAYLKDDDSKKRIDGLPNLPPPWNKLQYKLNQCVINDRLHAEIRKQLSRRK